MPMTHRLIAKKQYVDKLGEEKVKWVRCGIVTVNETGKQSVLIEQLPIGFDGWLSFASLDEKPTVGVNAGTSHANAGFDDMESDVPF